MESVGDVLKRQPSRFQYQDLVQQIVKDPDVATFIQKESLSQEELNLHATATDHAFLYGYIII